MYDANFLPTKSAHFIESGFTKEGGYDYEMKDVIISFSVVRPSGKKLA